MKLELKHLAPYLPYSLKYLYNDEILELDGLDVNGDAFNCDMGETPFENIKPILRPLSDLTKVNGFSLSDMISHGYHNPFWLPENFEVKYLMHLDFEKLVSWHFDVFGLIPAGLAIDINTLN